MAARAERWRGRLGEAALPDSPTFVAEGEEGGLDGFAHTGPVRDEDLDPDGRAEIYTLYVDPAAWRRGVGVALVRAVDEFWAPRGVRELSVWVFADNAHGRAFYEALGWQPDGTTQTDDFGGARPVELRYRRRLS